MALYSHHFGVELKSITFLYSLILVANEYMPFPRVPRPRTCRIAVRGWGWIAEDTYT